MMNGFNPPVTPEKIVKEGWRFSIPIYQRLFVWESEQIDRLLEDLWNASNPENNLPSPYYVGVITTVEQDDGKNCRVFSVVDGQQRLTFLLLFFSECLVRGNATEIANGFVFVNSPTHLRIRFIGRDYDEKYIQHYVRGEWNEVKNCNFRQFHDRMEIFIKKHEDWETKKDDFIKNVYENTSFLANELAGYSNADLNLYFEKMNSTGRQLSPLDQLKGILTSCVNGNDNDYASKWNDCFDFERTREENAKTGDGEAKNGQDFNYGIDDIVNWNGKVGDEPAPGQESASFARLPFRPEVLALHALQLTLEGNDAWKKKAEDERKKGTLYYSSRHMIYSFNTALGFDKENVASSFMKTLEEYRDWIDDNIIYLRGEEEADGDEVSNSSGLKYDFRSKDNRDNKKMLQLQSMLYVSSGERQEWILKAYEAYKDPKNQNFNLFTTLRSQALAKVKDLNPDGLSYSPGMDRFAFWMLDYLLWEEHYNNWSRDVNGWRKSSGTTSVFNELELTNEEHLAIRNYIFRANRSIEHFRPQNGAEGQWTEAKNGYCALDSFGNLCMISSSFNSTQSDDSINTKCGRIDDQVKAVRLESIKMLIIRKLAGERKVWTPKQAITHGSQTLRILEVDDKSIKEWKKKFGFD